MSKRGPKQKEYPGILDMYLSKGMTLQEIGDHFGFSRERARQILSQRYGVNASHAGWRKELEVKNGVKLAAQAEERAIRRGMSDDEYAKIRAKFPGAPYAYQNKKSNCRRIGIPFTLTFAEWWDVWGGRFGETGRSADALSIARIDITKPYEVGNVMVCRFGDAVLQRSKQGEK